MEHPKLQSQAVEDCPYRQPIASSRFPALAHCQLLQERLGRVAAEQFQVESEVCAACCQSFAPSSARLNPVLASLVYLRAVQIAAATHSATEAERLHCVASRASADLDVVYQVPLATPSTGESNRTTSLIELIPLPRQRAGPRVRQWAVGVTTAPRLQPTLEQCLASLQRAGWPQPHLFVDGAVRIPMPFGRLPVTFRETPIGAWPNYYLTLTELLLRQPWADAYMVVQDDALFFDGASLPVYLAEVLWPEGMLGLVSLFCNPTDNAKHRGWHRAPEEPTTGPVAMIFPRELAMAFVTDRAVFEHRWSSAPDAAAPLTLGGLITSWAIEHSIPIWFPTPCLVQHIGDTSTLWPWARALGARRATCFAGDVPLPAGT